MDGWIIVYAMSTPMGWTYGNVVTIMSPADWLRRHHETKVLLSAIKVPAHELKDLEYELAGSRKIEKY